MATTHYGPHAYICEGCSTDVPLTLRQYKAEMIEHNRLLCDSCKEQRLSRFGVKKGRDAGAGSANGGEAPSHVGGS
jgi:hypothetical protein